MITLKHLAHSASVVFNIMEFGRSMVFKRCLGLQEPVQDVRQPAACQDPLIGWAWVLHKLHQRVQRLRKSNGNRKTGDT